MCVFDSLYFDRVGGGGGAFLGNACFEYIYSHVCVVFLCYFISCVMISLIGALFLTVTVAMHRGVEWIKYAGFTLLKNEMAELLNFRV